MRINLKEWALPLAVSWGKSDFGRCYYIAVTFLCIGIFMDWPIRKEK